MLLAIAAVMGKDANEYFTLREDREEVLAHLQQMPVVDRGPDVADTVIEFAANTNRVVATAVESECIFGYVLSHYHDKGGIVRFLAIPD